MRKRISSLIRKTKTTSLIKEMNNALKYCYNIEDTRKLEKYFFEKIKKVKCADKYKELEYGVYFTRREIAKYLEELVYKVYERNGIYLREAYEE